jgi:hypothetical protein
VQVLMDDQTHVFDSFECAISALAPSCAHRGCMIIGHRVESGSGFHYCTHCAHAAGVRAAVDGV